MSPAVCDDVQAILTLALRWLVLSTLAYVALALIWTIARDRSGPPPWLPFLIGALLAAASWVAGRCG